MSEENDLIVGLPSYEEASRKVEEGRATALDLLIREHEPADKGDANEFRSRLAAVLLEAEGRFRVQAVYARLRGCCPYCDGADVAGPMDMADVDLGAPGYRVRVPMSCENCGARWKDVYDLLRVETVDAPAAGE